MAGPRSSVVRHYEAMDDSKDGCARICQFALFLVVATALGTGLVSTLSCEFMVYVLPPVPNTTASSNTADDNSDFRNSTQQLSPPGSKPEVEPSLFKAGLGVYRYKKDINSDVCYWYDFAEKEKPLELVIAQWGSSLAAGFAGLAVIFLLLEFCCCRYPCSRVFAHLCFFAGACAVVPVFGLYSHPQCNLLSVNAFACELGRGAYEAMACCGLLLISLCLSCMTPKATPIIRAIQEREQQSEHDPCVCGFCPGGCCVKKSKEDIYKEHPELLLAELPSDEVEVGNRTYKHYYDDQGGATLQSQFTAASERWLACERNYQTMLDRFKQECLDVQTAAPTNTKGISNKKTDDPLDDDNNKRRSYRYGSSSEIQQNADWKYLVSVPPESIKDPELSRLACLLSILRGNCQQAKNIMNRIEADLEEHIRSPEEKLNAALLEIELKKLQEEGHGKKTDIEAQDSSVHDAASDTDKHGNVTTTNITETSPQNGDGPRGSEDARSSNVEEPLLHCTSVMSDDNNDSIEAHVRTNTTKESDVFSSSHDVFSSTTMPPPTGEFMFDAADFEDPPSDQKNSHGWTPFKAMWGGSDSDKKTS